MSEQASNDIIERINAVLAELEVKRLAFEQERAAVLRAMVPVSQKDEALRRVLEVLEDTGCIACAFRDGFPPHAMSGHSHHELAEVRLAIRAALGETFPGRPDCPATVPASEIPL